MAALASKRTELRVLGTSVTLTEAVRKRAMSDLGLRIHFEVLDGFDAQRQAVIEQGSFDVYDQWFHSIDYLWPTGALQPIELDRIEHWSEVNALPKTGRIAPDARYGQGCNPVTRLYVQPDGSVGDVPSAQISMLPLTHNADSFVYLPAEIPSLFGTEESWSWLVSPACNGRVALQADAAIGALDAVLALRASGEMAFGDISNLEIEEVDRMIALLMAKKKAGLFRGFWGNYADAARMMIDARVAIQSNWSPAIAQYEQAGLAYRLARPREGYRAWYGGLGIARRAQGPELDAAYRYLNWWHSGWAGAVMARQGFYISNPLRTRAHLSAAEWGYWYAGLPAAEDLPGTDGSILIRRGSVRDGGSYAQRMSDVAVWNTVMDEHNYLVRKWTEFLRSG
ncbi:ABC transporter substrate-binding protein [Variovorax sp.]|uniref:ABC transporter substrate-binding protein n=1 Tax=Variovorax sp. TaxID=1871043 RepID=UPI003BAB519A